MAKFVREERIGSGGFGVVWRGRRDSDDHLFAMKYLADGAAECDASRFRKEVRCLQTLDHPNIVRVVGLRLGEAPLFYVMPLYRGSLFGELGGMVGDTARIKKVFGGVLDAVQYAHSQGVLHRDLKPENVLMNSDDNVVVSDFGLGRIVDSKTTRVTRTGEQMGTLAFAAPEQLRDAKAADERSDIFSLGRMLYELYSGEISTAQDLTSIPAPIAMLVERATRSAPSDRFQTVDEMRRAFDVATDVLLGKSQAESLDALLASVMATERATPEELRELAARLAEVAEDPDSVHSAMMRLPGPVFRELERESLSLARRLVRVFSEYVRSQGWPFDYTDSIAGTCEGLFRAVEDYEIRAELLLALLIVGAEHNRWHVMGVFGTLLAEAREDAEAHAFLDKLSPYPDALGQVSEYVEKPPLNPILHGLFRPAVKSAPAFADDLPF